MVSLAAKIKIAKINAKNNSTITLKLFNAKFDSNKQLILKRLDDSKIGKLGTLAQAKAFPKWSVKRENKNY